MTNRYVTKAEKDGHKRRVRAYRDKLAAQGLKPRQLYMTDAESERIRQILACWRGEQDELSDEEQQLSNLLKP